MTDLGKTIQDIGLSKKEAKIYLACLEVGENKVSVIAKASKLNRVTTYNILEKLSEKGIVSLVTKDNNKFYSAIKPETLLKRSEAKLQNFKKTLPILQKLSSHTAPPKIEYFEGIEGIKQVYADTLNSKTEILNYANSQLIRETWPEYDEEYVAKRIDRKVFLRGIAPHDELGLEIIANNKSAHRDIRLVPADLFDFSNEINIYDNKISIISLKHDLIGIIIENEDIANTQRSIFRMAWEFTKALQKLK